MNRAIIIVIDSCGCGALPDAEEYNDTLKCNTLGNVARVVGGLHLPNMQRLGIGNIIDIDGTPPVDNPVASHGKMAELSKGKDTTTGHWEIAGLVLDAPFRTYPEGFPEEVIKPFIVQTGCKEILANMPASGTDIINRLGEEHQKTGYPIIYTSADSVFQIACHVETIPLEKLYDWCKIAREILIGDHNVSRVIARPFEGTPGNYKRLSADRRDFSVIPTRSTILDRVKDEGGNMVAIGKIEDIYVKRGVTHAIHTGSNKEGIELTIKAIKKQLDLDKIAYFKPENPKMELIFTNLVDTDMLFGHRNDPQGYAEALKEIDQYLSQILEAMTDEDLLIITADHGCDPTVEGTDHTREYVPVIVYHKNIEAKNLGTRKTFADVGGTVAAWLGMHWVEPGVNML
ncbi:MAG: phosphopentomutase [Cyanobacteriota bacterium]